MGYRYLYDTHKLLSYTTTCSRALSYLCAYQTFRGRPFVGFCVALTFAHRTRQFCRPGSIQNGMPTVDVESRRGPKSSSVHAAHEQENECGPHGKATAYHPTQRLAQRRESV